jgi:hypothetical protein
VLSIHLLISHPNEFLSFDQLEMAAAEFISPFKMIKCERITDAFTST